MDDGQYISPPPPVPGLLSIRMKIKINALHIYHFQFFGLRKQPNKS